MAKLHFYGGAWSVTGAHYVIETQDAKVAIDCGLLQGSVHCPDDNYEDFAYHPEELNAVCVTHGHVDHIGRLPRLVRKGFRGPIYATEPTRELAPILLEDSQQILSHECKGKHEAIYSLNDVKQCLGLFRTIGYGDKTEVAPGISVRYRDASHILGSAQIEVWVREGSEERKVVFSGDLGNPPTPLLPPIDYIDEADYALIETTYGNRLHHDKKERMSILQDVIQKTVKDKGVLLVPSFAIERTQELLFELNHLVEHKLVPPIQIFLDSPMAIKATEVYRDSGKFFNTNTTNLILNGDDIFQFPRLSFTRTTEESKEINSVPPPKMIIAGSGMSNGGRILHHEKRYLSDSRNAILFVGYQSPMTLGRTILDGAHEVTILGDTIPVYAQTRFIDSYSAHADQKGLIKWVKAITQKKPLTKLFCVQGEQESSEAFAELCRNEMGVDAVVPNPQDSFELI